MKLFFSRKTIVLSIIFIVLIFSFFIYFTFLNKTKSSQNNIVTDSIPKYEIIGKSVQGRPIEAFTFGNGNTHLLFAGGMHGGYEWNSVLLAYNFIDYLNANPNFVPKNMSITVIPSINPDGVYKVIGKEGRFSISDVPTTSVSEAPGRFNANGVDLNRNFDCKWQATSTWQNKIESAGNAPFSEPESKAVRDYILKNNPVAVIFWHSQSNAVYASQCKNGILPVTLDIMNAYSKASGYPAVKTFSAYDTTGASDDWLASINIPALTVELKTHETIEWEKNLAGIKAFIDYFRTDKTLQ